MKLAGTGRADELVQTVIDAAAAVAGFAMATRRVALVQRIVSCGRADGLRKLASLPVALAVKFQLPAIGVAVLKSVIGVCA